MSLHQQPKDRIPPDRRLAALDRYQGQWVAVQDGDVVASAGSSGALARRLRELGLAGVARAEYVPEPVAGYRVGLG